MSRPSRLPVKLDMSAQLSGETKTELTISPALSTKTNDTVPVITANNVQFWLENYHQHKPPLQSSTFIRSLEDYLNTISNQLAALTIEQLLVIVNLYYDNSFVFGAPTNYVFIPFLIKLQPSVLEDSAQNASQSVQDILRLLKQTKNLTNETFIDLLNYFQDAYKQTPTSTDEKESTTQSISYNNLIQAKIAVTKELINRQLFTPELFRFPADVIQLKYVIERLKEKPHPFQNQSKYGGLLKDDTYLNYLFQNYLDEPQNFIKLYTLPSPAVRFDMMGHFSQLKNMLFFPNFKVGLVKEDLFFLLVIQYFLYPNPLILYPILRMLTISTYQGHFKGSSKYDNFEKSRWLSCLQPKQSNFDILKKILERSDLTALANLLFDRITNDVYHIFRRKLPSGVYLSGVLYSSFEQLVECSRPKELVILLKFLNQPVIYDPTKSRLEIIIEKLGFEDKRSIEGIFQTIKELPRPVAAMKFLWTTIVEEGLEDSQRLIEETYSMLTARNAYYLTKNEKNKKAWNDLLQLFQWLHTHKLFTRNNAEIAFCLIARELSKDEVKWLFVHHLADKIRINSHTNVTLKKELIHLRIKILNNSSEKSSEDEKQVNSEFINDELDPPGLSGFLLEPSPLSRIVLPNENAKGHTAEFMLNNSILFNQLANQSNVLHQFMYAALLWQLSFYMLQHSPENSALLIQTIHRITQALIAVEQQTQDIINNKFIVIPEANLESLDEDEKQVTTTQPIDPCTLELHERSREILCAMAIVLSDVVNYDENNIRGVPSEWINTLFAAFYMPLAYYLQGDFTQLRPTRWRNSNQQFQGLSALIYIDGKVLYSIFTAPPIPLAPDKKEQQEEDEKLSLINEF